MTAAWGVAMSNTVIGAKVCRKSLLREERGSRTFVAAVVKVFRIQITG